MGLLPRIHILIISLAVLSFLLLSCGNDDDDGTDDTDTGTGTEEPGCEDIEWGDEETYLVNGGTVANWQQSAFVDTNDSGMIDEDERVDVDIDFLGICETEKKSLVLLIATDN